MTDPHAAEVLTSTVSVTLTAPELIGGIQLEPGTAPPQMIVETVVEVSVTSPKHAAYVLNAAAVAADTALRATMEDHPAHLKESDCGR